MRTDREVGETITDRPGYDPKHRATALKNSRRSALGAGVLWREPATPRAVINLGTRRPELRQRAA